MDCISLGPVQHGVGLEPISPAIRIGILMGGGLAACSTPWCTLQLE